MTERAEREGFRTHASIENKRKSWQESPRSDRRREPKRLFVLFAYLLMKGLLMGYLAEQARVASCKCGAVLDCSGDATGCPSASHRAF
jgi:hypothetical protein